MKIASKINKATYTKLNKLNLKDLMIDINDQQGDLTIEANILAEGATHPNKYEEEHLNTWKETEAYWHKEVKAGFRVFRSNRAKIQKAHDKFLEAEAKAKAKKAGKK